MEGGDKRELAKKMAMARTRQTGPRKPLSGGGQGQNQVAKGNSLSFFGGEGDGWTMSPKTILLFSVAYMGCVILLHIFGKVTTINK